MSYKNFRYFLALLLLFVAIGGSFMRSAGFFIHDIYKFQELLGGDAVTHILMGGLVVISFRLILAKRSIFEILVLSILLLTIEEFSQYFIPTRKFLLIDYFMNLSGALAAGFLCLVVNLLWHQFSSGSALKELSNKNDS